MVRIDRLYILIEIRKLMFLSILLGFFNACATFTNLDTADNDSIGTPASLAITSTPMKSPVVNYSLELVVDEFQKPIYVTHAGDEDGVELGDHV